MSKMVSCARGCNCAEDMEKFVGEEDIMAPIKEDYEKRYRG